jgi:hypothetical protein
VVKLCRRGRRWRRRRRWRWRWRREALDQERAYAAVMIVIPVCYDDRVDEDDAVRISFEVKQLR